jgi:hypothetical protein
VSPQVLLAREIRSRFHHPDRLAPLETLVMNGEVLVLDAPASVRPLLEQLGAERGVSVVVLPTCRVCGCRDDRACAGGCVWAEQDLCSRCVLDDEGAGGPRRPSPGDDEQEGDGPPEEGGEEE